VLDGNFTFLGTTDAVNLINKLAGGLTILGGIAALVLVVFAIKHGIAIASSGTDPRERAERMKAVGYWAFGAIFAFAASMLTGALWLWTKNTLGG
jgi:hypothetical protein